MTGSARTLALAALALSLAASPAVAQVWVCPPAPSQVSYYAAPAVSYYAAPAPVVSYYAAPAVSYYAAPAATYYAAPAATYYPAPVAATTRYGLFGRPRSTTYYYYP
jgi:hypothetical protein